MAKLEARHRMCRRVGAPLCGRENCPALTRPYPPGQHGRRRRYLSPEAVRLLEKQKLRAIYGVPETQLRRYFERAARRAGVTGEEVLRLLETRLETIVYRLGFALSMRHARQLVSQGHVRVDGKRVDVRSAQVRPGQRVSLSPPARQFSTVHEALEGSARLPAYLRRDVETFEGWLLRYPEREEIPLPVPIDDRLVVEHYA